jgi:hypothetical protein
MKPLTYNERSWAIDLISEINLFLAKQSFVIHRAGGESGLKGDGPTLFPDVILFSGAASVLQGWELKMPDTSLSDNALIENARKKADLFNTNSYLLWNGSEAALFARQGREAPFTELKSWHRQGLGTRRDVGSNRSVWVEMLHEILRDIDHFLSSGALRASELATFDDEAFATNLVELLYQDDAEEIKAVALTDQKLRSAIDTWASDAGIDDKFNELAKLNILAWVNRFVFCHYLSRFNSAALRVQEIDSSCDAIRASEIFESISSIMDFSNVFVPGIADQIISKNGWEGRVAFNGLLSSSGVTQLSEASMRNVLDGFASLSKRRSQGQFATPANLARALAWLAVDDMTKPSWDPCCGSGSVAKALYDVRVSAGLSRQQSLENVWASDKQQMPLQLTSMNLSDPLAIKSVIQVFQSNVFDVNTGMHIDLTDPESPGTKVSRQLPLMASIASNLPYVRQELSDSEGRSRVFTQLEADGFIRSSRSFGKADIYAAIILDLERQLMPGGRLVVVVSNAWLANEWGREFKKAVASKFKMVAVIQSGAGRWFKNADVVTTVLVLEKSNTGTVSDSEVRFVTTKLAVEFWDDQYLNQLARATHSGIRSPLIDVNPVPFGVCELNSDNGFQWRINFAESAWLKNLIPLTIPIGQHFNVARGARTGCDEFFYPGSVDAAKIEPEYLVPVVSSSKSSRVLSITATKVAFCCTRSKGDLAKLGHHGALAWIEKFANRINATSGQPYWQHLKKLNSEWYTLDPNEQGEFCISINPDKSLPVFRAPGPVFINQRFTRMSRRTSDPDILHALLNSITTMLGIEFLGFGRGLGALDLSSNRVKDSLRILDPSRLTDDARTQILEAFKPLLQREYHPIERELKANDRIRFDAVVLSSYGLEAFQDSMYEALSKAVEERSGNRR